MPAIYVLNVPEFCALVDVSRIRPGYRVSPRGPNYFKIESDLELCFSRKELGFKPAVWYGSLTGGLDGKIVQFDRDELRVVGNDT